MPKLVGVKQTAFIKSRFILDNILITNEVIEDIKRCKRKSLIFKADFEKAFDSLNWEYLLKLLELMGFGGRWRSWMVTCLKSASISVLVNGSPTDEFYLKKGVRQGDPLSPYLFILATEGLNRLTKSALEKKSF
ncbi:secreted RxLR effector protein 78-like [Rutidosis leptorrhynchoides]|uniref:secreted RxLR effector protein 78-like n=1 Tax=Rutidosis leptorrhynchoides TaxID=125765 RepID=UPI003A9A0953